MSEEQRETILTMEIHVVGLPAEIDDLVNRVKEAVLVLPNYDLRINYAANGTTNLLSISVQELGLSVRVSNALRRAGIRVVNDLTQSTAAEIASVQLVGPISLREIELCLKNHNLVLAQQS